NIHEGIYGCRFINSGYNIQANINSQSVKRSLFIVGCSNIVANVNSRNQFDVADVVIKSYRNDNRNIHVNINSIDQINAENIVVLEHSNEEEDTTIENVFINLNVENRIDPDSWGRAVAVIGRSYSRTSEGLRESSTNITDNVKIE